MLIQSKKNLLKIIIIEYDINLITILELSILTPNISKHLND